jgi:hypothetical protein
MGSSFLPSLAGYIYFAKNVAENKKPAGLLRQRVMRKLVLANRYAHLIKRGAAPW